jgi:hypothetical protein
MEKTPKLLLPVPRLSQARLTRDSSPDTAQVTQVPSPNSTCRYNAFVVLVQFGGMLHGHRHHDSPRAPKFVQATHTNLSITFLHTREGLFDLLGGFICHQKHTTSDPSAHLHVGDCGILHSCHSAHKFVGNSDKA